MTETVRSPRGWAVKDILEDEARIGARALKTFTFRVSVDAYTQEDAWDLLERIGITEVTPIGDYATGPKEDS